MEDECEHARDYALPRVTCSRHIHEKYGNEDNHVLKVSIVEWYKGLDYIAQQLVVNERVCSLAPPPCQYVQEEAHGYHRDDCESDIRLNLVNKVSIDNRIILAAFEPLLPVGLAETAKANSCQHHGKMYDQSLGLEASFQKFDLFLVRSTPEKSLFKKLFDESAFSTTSRFLLHFIR